MTEKRPKLLRDISDPTGGVKAGTIGYPDSFVKVRMWAFVNATTGVANYRIEQSIVAQSPDWFAWVDVCDECDREECSDVSCVASLRFHHGTACHGHETIRETVVAEVNGVRFDLFGFDAELGLDKLREDIANREYSRILEQVDDRLVSLFYDKLEAERHRRADEQVKTLLDRLNKLGAHPPDSR